jgi:acetolactate synthase-1/2/3 large subunit
LLVSYWSGFSKRRAAAVGERERVEKRSSFDLEPLAAGHQSFPKRFGGHGASRLYPRYARLAVQCESEIWNIQISDKVTAPVIRQTIKRGHGNM